MFTYLDLGWTEICVDDGPLRALLSEGRDLRYTDSPVYMQLSRIIDTVDSCSDIVKWFSTDATAHG